MPRPEIDGLHRGIVLDLLRRAFFENPSIVHHRHIGRDAQSDVEIMLDDDIADMGGQSVEDFDEVAPFGWDVAIATSPVLYGDSLFVLADGNVAKHSRLIAFDKKTGDVRWEQKRPSSTFSHSTPVLVHPWALPCMRP